MFNAGFLSLSDDAIYFKNNFSYFSILPRYLLEVYLKESDLFLYNLQVQPFIKSFLASSVKIHKKFYLGFHEIRDYTPIKLELVLERLHKVRYVSLEKYLLLSRKYQKGSNFKKFFCSNLNFVRYLNFSLFGFLSNLGKARKLFRKYLFFIRSTIHFDIIDTKFSVFKDRVIYFLGFEIKLNKNSNNNYFSLFSFNKDKKFVSQMFNRLSFYRKKNLRNLFNRINFELINYVDNLVGLKIQKKKLEDKNLWMLIFQQEAIRSLRLGKLSCNNDSSVVISKSFFINFKKVALTEQFVYFFDSYLLKMQLLLSEVLRYYSYSSDLQLISSDTFFEAFLKEYKKTLFFFYNESYIKNFFQPVRMYL